MKKCGNNFDVIIIFFQTIRDKLNELNFEEN